VDEREKKEEGKKTTREATQLAHCALRVVEDPEEKRPLSLQY
jgi:hypothetical protein